MRARFAAWARASSAAALAARDCLPESILGTITASAAPTATIATPVHRASFFHGTGGISTSRGGVHKRSHAPTISKIEALLGISPPVAMWW
jgi:hypothetical protein